MGNRIYDAEFHKEVVDGCSDNLKFLESNGFEELTKSILEDLKELEALAKAETEQK